MRNFFADYKGLVLVLVMFSVLGFSFIANAKKQKPSTLDFGTQIERLAEQVERLVDLIGGEKEEVVVEGAEGTSLQNATGVVDPGCMDNYHEWPRSTTRKESASWSLNNFPVLGNTQRADVKNQFLDINGDGLVDYFYFDRRRSLLNSREVYYQNGYRRTRLSQPSFVSTGESACVLLNTGDGWDIAYRCKTAAEYLPENDDNIEVVEKVYYGDCAQL
ncbi:hypothetical protein [Tenacibaculum xiamenense]|uniref:hypothetical protein n=1 Tax=Tenacibaculum xiamenense TaxID=1261553 RepID=UPI0038B69964